MIILFCLLVFCFVLGFVYFYSCILKLEKNVDELYNLYYKKEYNFNFKEDDEKGSRLNVRKYIESFRSILDVD